MSCIKNLRKGWRRIFGPFGPHDFTAPTAYRIGPRSGSFAYRVTVACKNCDQVFAESIDEETLVVQYGADPEDCIKSEKWVGVPLPAQEDAGDR